MLKKKFLVRFLQFFLQKNTAFFGNVIKISVLRQGATRHLLAPKWGFWSTKSGNDSGEAGELSKAIFFPANEELRSKSGEGEHKLTE